MNDPELIPITEEDGFTYWLTRPLPACPNGHPFGPGNITTYSEAWVRVQLRRGKAAGSGLGTPPATRATLRRHHGRADVHRPEREGRLGSRPHPLTPPHPARLV